jgi:hypothetical protein
VEEKVLAFQILFTKMGCAMSWRMNIVGIVLIWWKKDYINVVEESDKKILRENGWYWVSLDFIWRTRGEDPIKTRMYSGRTMYG